MKPENQIEARRRAIRAQIDENLKRVYASALNEELPERLKDLLAKLRAGTGPGDGDDSG